MINQLINADLIQLDLQANSKQAVFEELINILHAQGRISDKAAFLKDIQAREELGNTGFEDGVAIPHAKSAAVTQPAVAIGVSREGIDYGAEDGLPSKLFFMIASPDGGDNHHIEVLAELSSKLIEEGFIEAFLNTKNSEQALELLLKKSAPTPLANQAESKGLIIGVTGCPAGIAHTYLAAEALEKGAAALGFEIKVETNGSIGVKNSPSAEEIERAEAIVVACDKQVDMARFAGKRLIKTNVKAPIRDAQKLINEALRAPTYQAETVKAQSVANKASQARSDLYRFLMNGVSHMIPFVVTGGLLIALALAVGGEPTEAGMAIPAGSMWNQILEVGVVAFTLMIPILAGYIAYAIADRPALSPGLIGWIANNGSFYGADAGTGFIGAIIAGLLVGYFVKWITSINYHKFIQPLVPIMIAPITASLFIAGLFIFVIGAPIASLMDGLTALLTSMSSGNVILLGIVLGGMAGFDMGGPFNKVAFLFSVGMIASGQTQFMGAMACAIPVAPLGMALATAMGRKLELFESSELEAGKAAGAMGLVGISEGAIPFAAQDPMSVIPANVLGSMVAAVMAFSFGITNSVAHGGPVVALLGAMNYPLLALLCMAAGAGVTAITCVTLKKIRSQKFEAAAA
ncbi:PTS system fructose-specific transporter subunit IIABC [Vibrio cholerae]|uniref:fructose-specific PTS transporter subunit EIIC n=1 Tax=Vibrio cholerae TaxID=666 RepID=UPI000663CB35|nr:fructose-specific PTS transporter subunit EIIC [Vibrio cholerae]CSB68864.1 PTS system fructose-specific transporter subunit IIABC [Vibrio cholerae]